MTRIILKASDVAAIIGRNPYKPSSEVRDELCKKYWPENFKGKTKTDKAHAALSFSLGAQKVLADAQSIEAKSSDDAQAIFVNAKTKIEKDSQLTKVQKEEVIEHLRSKVYTGHGTRSEDITSNKLEKDEGVRLVRDDAFYTLHVCEIEGSDFEVVGKIDRIEERPDGSRVLVEIKNRTKRFFSTVPEYEYIQVQTYLQMLGLDTARLVQQFNSEVRSHTIKRDDEFWSREVIGSLQDFCSELFTNVGNAP